MSLPQTEKYLKALKKHLITTKQAFCFDEAGRLWSRKEVDNILTSFKLY